jgi:ATP-dependent DNA helicase RecG
MNILPVTDLKGIGPKTASALSKLGITTTEDLIRHYPSRFVKFPETGEIDLIEEGMFSAVCASPVNPLQVIRRGSFVMTEALLSDGTGEIAAVWYHMPYLKNSVKSEKEYVFCGKAVRKRGRFYLEQPRIFRPEEYALMQGKLQPVYPLTAGIGNATIVKAVNEALESAGTIEDYLSQEMRTEYGLTEEDQAVRMIHHPETDENFQTARKRIVFDEFFRFLCQVRLLKKRKDNRTSAYRMETEEACREITSVLPYKLTDDQKKAVADINADLSGGHIMNRLLQGDVGSGKTAVAAVSLYTAFRNGYQSAIMVPTEVLAEQHFRTLTGLFAALSRKPQVLLLTGSLSASEKKKAKEQIRNHEADIVIGTHALIQDSVIFDRLSLVVTDEQHRFGVGQREALSGKGNRPHVLAMSATPIPRTLAVILYGDLDISEIKSRPEGRIPVLNCVIGKKDRPKAYRHILSEIQKGHQAYIICPLVEESEFSDEENVTDYCVKIREIFGDSARTELLHGKMNDKMKNRIMQDFVDHRMDILISTTVIEVGVDVPNATVMMIENADRFGLATLHQLRGRTGRGKDQSYCIFVNTSHSENAGKRLEILNRSNDGFKIAEEDLKQRGPGELFGLQQSGELTFGMADIYNDSSVLKDACRAVKSADEEVLNKYFYTGQDVNL